MIETNLKVLCSIQASVVSYQIQNVLSTQKKSLSKNIKLMKQKNKDGIFMWKAGTHSLLLIPVYLQLPNGLWRIVNNGYHFMFFLLASEVQTSSIKGVGLCWGTCLCLLLLPSPELVSIAPLHTWLGGLGSVVKNVCSVVGHPQSTALCCNTDWKLFSSSSARAVSQGYCV